MTRVALALFALVCMPSAQMQAGPAVTGTRLAGLRTGRFAVGFEVRSGVDATRRINASDDGTAIGLATWYPAQPGTAGDAVTALEYRLLDSRQSMSDRKRRAREDDEVNAMLSWRHVGIVEMTDAQARASLASRGVALRNAPAAEGRFPVVVIAGGPSYLSTTAEVLASHGFLVVAPFRYVDQSNEIGALDFTWYVENSARDVAWAILEAGRHPHGDAAQVALIGHGGGGMTAMLATMRDRTVDALVNIDAGNFSSRSQPERLAFYSPRLLTVPYLYIATASTRQGQDRFDQFAAMRFSARTEVVFDVADLRHHDLSDYGRGVTAPLGIRGEAQARVQQAFSDVEELTIRFLVQHLAASATAAPSFASWLESQRAAGRFAVSLHAGTVPAPTVVEVLRTLGPSTASALREARKSDADAPLFGETNLALVVEEALAREDRGVAVALASFAVELHPAAARLLELNSTALERSGDRPGALQRANACAAIEPVNDWRASGAVARCRAAVTRLSN